MWLLQELLKGPDVEDKGADPEQQNGRRDYELTDLLLKINYFRKKVKFWGNMLICKFTAKYRSVPEQVTW